MGSGLGPLQTLCPSNGVRKGGAWRCFGKRSGAVADALPVKWGAKRGCVEVLWEAVWGRCRRSAREMACEKGVRGGALGSGLGSLQTLCPSNGVRKRGCVEVLWEAVWGCCRRSAHQKGCEKGVRGGASGSGLGPLQTLCQPAGDRFSASPRAFATTVFCPLRVAGSQLATRFGRPRVRWRPRCFTK